MEVRTVRIFFIKEVVRMRSLFKRSKKKATPMDAEQFRVERAKTATHEDLRLKRVGLIAEASERSRLRREQS